MGRAHQPKTRAVVAAGVEPPARSPKETPSRTPPLPTKEGNAMNDKKMMQIVGAVERTVGDEKKAWWTRIGVAFENADGSWNLRFDYLPARVSDTTIQLREIKPKVAAQNE
jgi:hypothetical protein